LPLDSKNKGDVDSVLGWADFVDDAVRVVVKRANLPPQLVGFGHEGVALREFARCSRVANKPSNHFLARVGESWLILATASAMSRSAAAASAIYNLICSSFR